MRAVRRTARTWLVDERPFDVRRRRSPEPDRPERGLEVEPGRVQVFRDPFAVFFLTETFFGPDPYCGYEYAEGDPIEDPRGSGRGEAERLGDGWYRVCAR